VEEDSCPVQEIRGGKKATINQRKATEGGHKVKESIQQVNVAPEISSRSTSRLKRSHQLTSKEQVRARPPLTKKAILRLKEQGDEGRDERARTGDG